MAKAQSRQPPDFLLSGQAYQDGKLEHRGDFTQEADLVRKICGAHGECQMIAEVRDVRRNGGGRGLCGGAGKIIVDGVFPGRPSWCIGDTPCTCAYPRHRRKLDNAYSPKARESLY